MPRQPCSHCGKPGHSLIRDCDYRAGHLSYVFDIPARGWGIECSERYCGRRVDYLADRSEAEAEAERHFRSTTRGTSLLPQARGWIGGGTHGDQRSEP